MPPFTIAGGTYVAPSGGVEKVTYTSISDSLKEVLSVTQTSGYLSCALPIGLYKSSSVSSVKIAFGTNIYTPDFDGSEGVDYVTIKGGSGSIFSASGITLCLPLSKITLTPGDVTSLSIVVQTSSALVSSLPSEAVVSVVSQISAADIPTPPPPPTPSGMAVGAYMDCTATGASAVISGPSGVGFGDTNNGVGEAYTKNGPLIFGFAGTGSETKSSTANPTNVYIKGDAEIATAALKAKDAGFLYRFLSFGGEWSYSGGGANTLNATGITPTNIAQLATNMVALAINNNCNGIDYDFEMDFYPNVGISPSNYYLTGLPTTVGTYYSLPTSVASNQLSVQTFIQDLTDNIRQAYATYQTNNPSYADKQFYIVCAPQMGDIGSGNYGFISGGLTVLYNKVLSRNTIGTTNSAFDFILPQVYNSGTQYDPNFIVDKWSEIMTNSTIPSDSPSKIYVGYPATAGSAGNASIFHGYSATGGSGTYSISKTQCPAPYTAYYATNDNYTVANIFDSTSSTSNRWHWTAVDLKNTLLALKNGATSTYKNFAGVYCWNLTRDYYNWVNDGAQYEPGSSNNLMNPQRPVAPWTPNGSGIGTGSWGKGMRNILGV